MHKDPVTRRGGSSSGVGRRKGLVEEARRKEYTKENPNAKEKMPSQLIDQPPTENKIRGSGPH